MNNQDDVKMIEDIKMVEHKQFAAWHRIVELQQILNATKIISIFYDQFNLEEGLLTLILDGPTFDLPIHTFADANGSELQIQVHTGPSDESLHEVIEGEHNISNDRRFLTAGTLRDCSDAPNTLLIMLDDDILRLIENDQLSIPESGWVRIKIENEKLQLGHIQQAIDHIAKGQVRNPKLIEIIKDPSAVSFRENEQQCPISTKDLVFLQNEQNLSIIQAAFNAQHLYLIDKSEYEKIYPILGELFNVISQNGKRSLVITKSDEQLYDILRYLGSFPTLRPIILATTDDNKDEITTEVGYRVAVPSPYESDEDGSKYSNELHTYFRDLEHANNLAPQLNNIATRLLELEKISNRSSQELEQKSIQYDRLYQAFIEKTHQMEDLQDVNLFLEKLLRRITQPVFGKDQEDLSKQEENLNVEFVTSNSTFIDLNRHSEAFSNELSDWMDVTLFRFDGSSKHPIITSFRNADQIYRKYTLVRSQADEILTWLQEQENYIQKHSHMQKNIENLSKSKAMYETITNHCQEVIISHQLRIPIFDERIQILDEFNSHIDLSGPSLNKWVDDLLQSDLDPACLSLPEPFDDPKFDFIWQKIWDRFPPPERVIHGDEDISQTSAITECENLTREISRLIEQLAKYTTPETVIAISPEAMNWDIPWIKDLVDYDTDSDCAQPEPQASNKLKDMGNNLISNLENPDWVAVKFQGDTQKSSYQIAHRTVQLNTIAHAVQNQLSSLCNEQAETNNKLSDEEPHSDREIVSIAILVCQELRTQVSNDLLLNQNRITRAELQRAKLETNISQIENQLEAESLKNPDVPQMSSPPFDATTTLTPSLPLFTLLDQYETIDHENWSDKWRQEMFLFEGKLYQLDQLASQIEPTEQLNRIMSDLKEKIQEFEVLHSQLEQNIQTMGKEVDRIHKSYETNSKELMVAKQEWRSIYQEIPDNLTRGIEIEDITSESWITEILFRLELWQLNLSRLADFLNPSVYMSNDWRNYMREDTDKSGNTIEKQIKFANIIATTIEFAGQLSIQGRLPQVDVAMISDAHTPSTPEILSVILNVEKLIMIGNLNSKPPLCLTKTADEIVDEYSLEETDIELLEHCLFTELYKLTPEDYHST